MNKKLLGSILFALVTSLCLSGILIAQEITGNIVGTARDANGAGVAGATITIIDVNKSVIVRTVTTNSDGEFSVPNLPSSLYSVTVEAPNFKKSVQTNVKVDVGQRRLVDIIVEAGRIEETVTVVADALSVETTTPQASTVINGDQVRELSINNRNFTQLVTLAPGVSNDLSDQVYVGTVNPEGQANTVQIAVNGGRATQNTFTVDGADITDRGSNLTIQAYPSVDSIGEFRVLRSLFPAEAGSSGGGQVNIITRSGGRKFHGNFFEFVRNEKLNANDFITNRSTNLAVDANGKRIRRPFRYNNFGWTVGGPVYFFNFGENNGGMFRKYDKTFFFFSEEWRRDIRYPTLNSTVPDANLRQGIFPFPVCANRAYLGEACTGGNILSTIPSTRFNPASAAYLTNIYNRLPLPSVANIGTLSFPTQNIANFRQEIFKLDTSFTDKWSAYYRFGNDKIPTLDANALFSSGSGIPNVSTTSTNSPGKTHTFQSTYVISPSLILEGRYTYAFGAILSENVGLLSLANGTVPINLPYNNERDRVPTITGNGFSSLQSFGPYDNFSNKHNIGGSLSWVSGSHTMKFGSNYSKYRKNENALPGVANEGTFGTFSATLPAGTVPPAGISAATAANLQRWANFLVGNVGAFSQTKFDYTFDARQQNLESYAQDEWRFRSNLTLYLGVRHSYFGSPSEANGRLSNFIPALYNAQDAPAVTGAGNRIATANEFGRTPNWCNGFIFNTPSNPDIVIPSTYPCTLKSSPLGSKVVKIGKRDFAPRVGLAWDPFKKGQTAIRMGYGMYHEQFANGGYLNIIARNSPIQETAAANNVRLDQPLPPGPVTPQALAGTGQIRAVQYDWKTPYVQQWSLDVQQQVTKNTLVTIGYYGSKGVHLTGAVDINLVPPGTARNSQCARGNDSIITPAVVRVQCQPIGYAYRNSAITAAAGNPNVVGATAFTDILILDQIRPYRGYRAVNMIQPRFDSNYHSLQIFGQHRFGGVSQVNLAYTWAKNLTNSQSDASAPQNPYDIRSDYGRATLDRRHVLSANYVYEIPFFKKQEGFAGKVLGGWQVSGIVTFNTGLPLTATSSNYDPAGLGFLGPSVSAPRGDQIGDPNTGGTRTFVQWFNTAAFATVPICTTTACPFVSNTPSTAGRGTINGPPTSRVDFTLMRNFRFNESMRLQLRGEAFNILNHTNFRGVATNVTLATFGNVTTVRDPRVIQLAAKFYW